MYCHLMSIIFVFTLSFRKLSCRESENQSTHNDAPSYEEIRKVCGIAHSSHSRLVGGRNATMNAWPWMVAIFTRQMFGDLACGGSLISSEFVLTAAHCMEHPFTRKMIESKDFTLRLGELDFISTDDEANPIDFGLASYVVHKGYNHKTNENDLAVLKLDEAVAFSNSIIPICLPETEDLVDSDYLDTEPYVVGWGRMAHNGEQSTMLQEMQISVYPFDKCKKALEKVGLPITEAHVCIKADGKDACQGDSGGPLMLADCNDQMNVIGVSSAGYLCGSTGFPSSFTRVASFLSWIKTNAELI